MDKDILYVLVILAISAISSIAKARKKSREQAPADSYDEPTPQRDIFTEIMEQMGGTPQKVVIPEPVVTVKPDPKAKTPAYRFKPQPVQPEKPLDSANDYANAAAYDFNAGQEGIGSYNFNEIQKTEVGNTAGLHQYKRNDNMPTVHNKRELKRAFIFSEIISPKYF